MNSFAAVIFDCDGVLVDSETLAIRGERAALLEMGLDYSPADYVRRFVGLHDGRFMDILRADYLAAFGRAAPADFEERVIAGRRREMGALTVIAGADAAMRAAMTAAGRVAVASSSRAHFLEAKLRRMGLWERAAPHVYSADLVAAGKPAPDIFLYAAEKLAVDPAHCLALEDSENGVTAARAAGMTVWGFTGGGHCYEGHADRLLGAGAHWVASDFAAFMARLATPAPRGDGR
jgi:beta-phosphoglucomutase-like phosphatase (HAD superfamily)